MEKHKKLKHSSEAQENSVGRVTERSGELHKVDLCSL